MGDLEKALSVRSLPQLSVGANNTLENAVREILEAGSFTRDSVIRTDGVFQALIRTLNDQGHAPADPFDFLISAMHSPSGNPTGEALTFVEGVIRGTIQI